MYLSMAAIILMVVLFMFLIDSKIWTIIFLLLAIKLSGNIFRYYKPVPYFVFDGQQLQVLSTFGHVQKECSLEQLELVNQDNQEVLYEKEGEKKKRLVSSKSFPFDAKQVQELLKALRSKIEA